MVETNDYTVLNRAFDGKDVLESAFAKEAIPDGGDSVDGVM